VEGIAAIIIVLLLLLAVGAVVGFYVYRLKVKNDTTPFRTALQRMTGKPTKEAEVEMTM